MMENVFKQTNGFYEKVEEHAFNQSHCVWREIMELISSIRDQFRFSSV